VESNAAVFNITQSETSMIAPGILPFEANPGPSNTAGQTHQDTERAVQGKDCIALEFVPEEGKSNENNPKAPISVSKEKAEPGYRYLHASIDEEDVCPTCLEGDQSVTFSSNFLIIWVESVDFLIWNICWQSTVLKIQG